MRSALGAARGRIIRQLLESLVLAALGGMLGIGVGAAILRGAPALIPAGLLPAAVTPAFDARVVLFGLAAALAVGVVFGVIPEWQATGGSLAGVMASESRSSTSTSRRFRSLLVSGEVAAAVVLLCGAGLLLQTLLKLVGGDTGYRATSDSILTLDFSVPTGKGSRYPTAETVTQFYDAGVATSARCPRCAASGGRRACRTARASWAGGRSRSSVPVVILLTAIIDAAAPAWRASRINPVEAFRYEGWVGQWCGRSTSLNCLAIDTPTSNRVSAPAFSYLRPREAPNEGWWPRFSPDGTGWRNGSPGSALRAGCIACCGRGWPECSS